MKRETMSLESVKLKTGQTVVVKVEKRPLGPVKNVAHLVKKNKMVAH